MRAPDFWERDGGASALLAPAAWIYASVVRLRLRSARPRPASVPVMCVGNVVAGGAGKTPVVLSLAGRLAARGVEAHVLTRGYGGTARGPLSVDPDRHTNRDVGDEALLLARVTPTWVARDRNAGAGQAAAAGADAVIMDDGFQNPSLVKDISLLVVDGVYGFGNGLVMPAGPLREPVAAALARADAVVVMAPDEATVGAAVASMKPDMPILAARAAPAPDGADLAGEPVLAFAGIGRPQKFFDTLKAIGADVRRTHSFPDHHPYSTAEIERLLAEAKGASAILVTTAKDAVRVPESTRDAVRVLTITVEWEDEAAVESLLDRLMSHGR